MTLRHFLKMFYDDQKMDFTISVKVFNRSEVVDFVRFWSDEKIPDLYLDMRFLYFELTSTGIMFSVGSLIIK